ncbi:MAG: CBS domain-containing protein [Gloeomargaritaceae cyanobacterium C42_A2020_066]|nr:CBS domain-containing protein [Gloeomargaritaceae cyanobacterium C42_A2020_066]
MAMTVADAMTPAPLVVHPETPIEEAIHLLVERQISGLPVVDVQGHLVGVLSNLDILERQQGLKPPTYLTFMDAIILLENPRHYRQELHKALGATVGDVMTPHPVTVTADKPLTAAAHLMTQRRVQRLPVVDAESKVIGIITRGDIVRTLAQETSRE